MTNNPIEAALIVARDAVKERLGVPVPERGLTSAVLLFGIEALAAAGLLATTEALPIEGAGFRFDPPAYLGCLRVPGPGEVSVTSNEDGSFWVEWRRGIGAHPVAATQPAEPSPRTDAQHAQHGQPISDEDCAVHWRPWCSVHHRHAEDCGLKGDANAGPSGMVDAAGRLVPTTPRTEPLRERQDGAVPDGH